MPPMTPPIFCFKIFLFAFHFLCRLILDETTFNLPAPITSYASRY